MKKTIAAALVIGMISTAQAGGIEGASWPALPINPNVEVSTAVTETLPVVKVEKTKGSKAFEPFYIVSYRLQEGMIRQTFMSHDPGKFVRVITVVQPDTSDTDTAAW